ncbi:hypothetical protein FC83_GL003109 [Agrilactobacillus composti DSM 18527 = JCM 14202]|uniref:Uncharacterized protein n=1 Tax=Agrilactobacillus composti DSM 18527 = JCM 14202 TaxID=1423734 RepID=A0A0R1XYI2_9LACO|nr:hypothetical protein [Agrilactobacillus composti]KRM33035.1 hypothetical protein FC83_GL003109 [Agrilactobacillus composti DSM 18527 = JCM 14202]
MEQKFVIKRSTRFFVLLFIILLLTANWVILQTFPAFLMIVCSLAMAVVMAYLDGHAEQYHHWLIKTARIALFLSLLGVMSFVHETSLSTGGESHTIVMFPSNATRINIKGQPYVVTSTNNTLGFTRTYFFNLYKRLGPFYVRINPRSYIVTAVNVGPDEDATWVFKNIVLKDRTELVTAKNEFRNDSQNPVLP